MGEKYRFFDSIEGEDERFYTADEFAEYFRQFIRNGIFTGGENLKVETYEKDMKISIKPGYAWIEGYLYKIAGEDLILEHGIADPSLNRIDRVVIRLDKTLENRYVKAFILEGTPESTPKAPSLTRNDNVYEISLAQVEIIAGKSFIESYQITDERLDNTVCGIATHLFEQVDTTDIFNEWQNYLIHKRNQSDLSYEEFVTAYQNIWNSWIEEKISEPSGEFYAEWKSWFNEVQDTTNLVTKSQFDEHLISFSEHKTKLASTEEVGHMSSDDKAKLDDIEENANNYIHPNEPGHFHIPAGGSIGQVLTNVRDGEAQWAKVALVSFVSSSKTLHATGSVQLTFPLGKTPYSFVRMEWIHSTGKRNLLFIDIATRKFMIQSTYLYSSTTKHNLFGPTSLGASTGIGWGDIGTYVGTANMSISSINIVNNVLIVTVTCSYDSASQYKTINITDAYLEVV